MEGYNVGPRILIEDVGTVLDGLDVGVNVKAILAVGVRLIVLGMQDGFCWCKGEINGLDNVRESSECDHKEEEWSPTIRHMERNFGLQ